ncbi:MAG: hypothetical protein HGB17_06830 [Syntrophobacteraceae bacterium]|nr:hypothetical protein [Syntrophobacteraceae bacterium]
MIKTEQEVLDLLGQNQAHLGRLGVKRFSLPAPLLEESNVPVACGY